MLEQLYTYPKAFITDYHYTTIENMYSSYSENGNHKVTYHCHLQYGSSNMLHFLTQSGVVTQEWKNQYIGHFIPVAGAWSDTIPDLARA